MQAPEILDKAAHHMRELAATYDQPEGERSMAKTVAVFNVFHGTNLTEEQGWHFMQIVKDVRFFTKDSYHHDSVVDGVNYAALRGECRANQPKQTPLTAAEHPVPMPIYSSPAPVYQYATEEPIDCSRTNGIEAITPAIS